MGLRGGAGFRDFQARYCGFLVLAVRFAERSADAHYRGASHYGAVTAWFGWALRARGRVFAFK